MKLSEQEWLQNQVRILSDQFRRRQGDCEFEAAGGLVLYALDNDVMICVSAPWRCRSQKYISSAIARKRGAREALAYVLAEYFIRERDDVKKPPYLVLEPTEKERQKVWRTVYAKAESQRVSINAAFDELSRTLREYEDEDVVGDHALFELARSMLEIIHQNRGPIAELQRISRILTSNTIVPLRRITDRGLTLQLPDGKADKKELIKARQEWLRELDLRRRPRNHSTSRRGDMELSDLASEPTNNEYDADLMSRIEALNRKFSRDETHPTRICLVTGDATIEQIANERAKQVGVTEYFVRSPVCFLADREFFRLAGVPTPDFLADLTPEPSGELAVAIDGYDARQQDASPHGGGSMREWLDVLRLSEAVDPEQTNFRDIFFEMERAVDQWQRYLESAGAQAGFQEATATLERRAAGIASLRADRSLLLARLEELRKQFLDISNEAMTNFGVAGVLAAFWSLQQTDRWPSRIVPAVHFDLFKKADAVAASLLNITSLSDAKKLLTREQIEPLLADDPTGYTVFAVFALAFALAGRWSTAFTVARAANSLAARHDRRNAHAPKGDEAAYLCAVCCHASVKRPDDLDECEKWLQNAELLQRQPRFGEEEPRLQSPVEQLRIDVERLALSVTRRNFAVFSDHAHGMADVVKSLSIQKQCQSHLELLDRIDNDISKHVRRSVCLQAATNFLQLQLHAKLANDTVSIMIPGIDRCLQTIRDNARTANLAFAGDGRDDLDIPVLAKFIYYCTVGVFWKPLDKGEEIRQTGFADRTEAIGSRLDVMPYDKDRVRRLMELVRAEIAKR